MESKAARPRSVSLATPASVLVAIPALVALLGVTMTVLGLAALRAESESMAKEVLVDQATYLGDDTAAALEQADPILSRMHEIAAADDPSRPLALSGPALHDAVLAHAGITYVSVSFPDGTFRGAYLNAAHEVELQESRAPEAGGKVQRWRLDHGALVAAGAPESSIYDPRTRPFYELATRKGARAWTEPYTFYDTHVTGITCTEPVLDAAGKLHAVVTVDFDVDGLSTVLGQRAFEGARTIVFSQDGTILAYSGGEAVPRPKGDALLRAEDLGDPAIVELTKQAPGARAPVRYLTLGAGDATELAAIAAVKPAPRAGAPFVWYVATLAPQRSVLGPLRGLQRRAVLANVVAVVIAIVVAILLALHITRMKRDLATTQASLGVAEKRARELGSYRLVARLGKGGQGEVWRAEHRLLAREAAIKLIRADVDSFAQDELRARFRLEAQALASMRSRHTIELFDYGVSDDGVFFYVMELLDGLDLETLVGKFGPQPAARVISILAQACSSLGEAHGRNLLHRDVKPANLFLCRLADEVDVVKVLDFGLVNQMTGGSEPMSRRAPRVASPSPSSQPGAKLTEVGMVLGTPGFMAPEQARGIGVDARADLYALGCVAFWLLTGREVYENSDVAALIADHQRAPLPDLAALIPTWYPKELVTLVMQCLAKSPADRPESALDLAAALRAIPIPAEHAWGEAEAQAWWRNRVPPERTEAVATQPVVLVKDGQAG